MSITYYLSFMGNLLKMILAFMDSHYLLGLSLSTWFFGLIAIRIVINSLGKLLNIGMGGSPVALAHKSVKAHPAEINKMSKKENK